MRVPPTPAAVLSIADWEWHKAGVDGARRRALVHAARVAHRLERGGELRGRPGRDLLRTVPGIGFWTAAEVAQRAGATRTRSAWATSTSRVSSGTRCWAGNWTTRACWRCWRPYAPHRQRVVRYLEAGGFPGRGSARASRRATTATCDWAPDRPR